MVFQVSMVGAEGANPQQMQEAIDRYVCALENALGGPELLAPVYAAYVRLRAVYGETPDLEALTDAERMIYEQWQGAETLALVAALGPHRYLDEPQFEIGL